MLLGHSELAVQPGHPDIVTAEVFVDPPHQQAKCGRGIELGGNIGGHLGTGLGQAVLAGMKEGSAESHLRLLTRQGFASVHPRLPSLLRYVQDKDAQVDWAVLLDELSSWDVARDEIATRWLQSFYRTLHAPRTSTDNPADAQSPKTEESETP